MRLRLALLSDASHSRAELPERAIIGRQCRGNQFPDVAENHCRHADVQNVLNPKVEMVLDGFTLVSDALNSSR